MSDIISLSDWLLAQTDRFEKKRRFLIFSDIHDIRTGERVKEGFRYFHVEPEELLAAFDNDDIDALNSLQFALDAEGEVDTSALCLKIAYTESGSFLAAQPQQYIDYAPTNLREPKYLAVVAPVTEKVKVLDQSR